jgi:putative ABC transport system permease protein
VRLALGAQARDILALVVGGGLRLTLAGVVLGLAGSWFIVRFLQTISPQFSSADPAVTAAITGFLILVALLACYLPARRATKVDPLIALRAE